jgi:hypothetical protein
MRDDDRVTDTAAYALADGVGQVYGQGDDEGVIYVAKLPAGPPLVLRDSGAVIWRAAVAGGLRDDIVKRTALEVGVDPETIRVDVGQFIEELVQLGLLVRVGTP